MPPSRLYLFALAQPAMIAPMHADAHHREREEQPDVQRAPTWPPRPDRDHREHDEVRDQRHAGREHEDPPVGRPRDDVLLLGELHAVGDELRPAVEATGVHRAEPALHVRHHLVLGLPDQQRQQRNAATTSSSLTARARSDIVTALGADAASHASSLGGRRVVGRGPLGGGPQSWGTPGGSMRRRLGAPARTRRAPSRPARAWRPGRPARTPCAADAPRTRREQQRLEVRVPVEDHAEHLVRLPLVPVRAAVDAGRGRQTGSARGTRVRTSRWAPSRSE